MSSEEMYFTYNGLLLPSETHSLESLKFADEFTFKDDDVVAATYPKTGRCLSALKTKACVGSPRSRSKNPLWTRNVTNCLSALLSGVLLLRTAHCSCLTACYELQSLAHSERSSAVSANSGGIRLSAWQGPEKSNGHQQVSLLRA